MDVTGRNETSWELKRRQNEKKQLEEEIYWELTYSANSEV